MPRTTSGQLPQHRHNRDRMRRADSWLKRSEKTARERAEAANNLGDAGLACEQFMFLWIAFNAAYGYQLVDKSAGAQYPERMQFRSFLYQIVSRDKERTIEKILWEKYSGPVRNLLENQYVFRPFWERVRGAAGGEDWEYKFYMHKKESREFLKNMNKDNKENVINLLYNVLLQLYELRNQAFHGGMTYAEGWGRDQVRDGCNIMAALVPPILDIMRADIEENPDTAAWGKVAYPRINERMD